MNEDEDVSMTTMKFLSQAIKFTRDLSSDPVDDLAIPRVQANQSLIFPNNFLKALVIFLLHFTAQTLW